MNKIKKTFSDWRAATPKRVQWLLLAVAFVVVLILLTLLLTGGKSDKKIEEVDSTPVNLVITPESLDWADVTVGQTKNQVIKVSATGPAKVLKIRREQNINGLIVNQGCENAGEINSGFACTITIDYTPTTAMTARGVPLFIDWRGINEPDEMKKTDKFLMVLGATAPVVEAPAPVVIEKVVEKVIEKPVEKIVVKEAEPEEEEEIEIEEETEEEPAVELIATTKPFDTVNERKSDEYVAPPEACSDFAFPGYDNSGRQIGWIKPKGGAYYFHPFSDKKCEKPTGTYNPDNGIITDIKDKSKKIGSDADHIGYAIITNGVIPELSNPVKSAARESMIDTENRTVSGMGRLGANGLAEMGGLHDAPAPDVEYESSGNSVKSSKPYDRQFVLRQFKPIPATIVSDVRADPEALKNNRLPVRATVDRNVYSDNGRNVIIPTGTLLMGYVDGDLPGPYASVGRMDIKWYQFILPNGVEFNFDQQIPFSGDAQGRSGIPGYGSTDYIEQFFMPMLTAIVPAAVNLIAPVSDAFVNQIDLDNNTVVQSGTVRSSELAKNEIITAWNQVAQKLLIDMMDNTVPPFTIAAGTRITVYSPVDLIASCGEKNGGKKCSLGYEDNDRKDDWTHSIKRANDGSWEGQVRSFAISQCCNKDGSVNQEGKGCDTYDYRTLVFYCQSSQYKAINMAKQDALFQSQQKKFQDTYQVSNTGEGLTGVQGDQAYNEQVLGLTYDEDGYIENPFEKKEEAAVIDAAATVLTCEDGSLPDANGCCAGEVYTDMGEQGFNCCPSSGGDCFPPIL